MKHVGDAPTGTGEVKGPERDAAPEGSPLVRQPTHGPGTTSTWADVEQLPGPDVDNQSGEEAPVMGPEPDHEHLVEPESGDRSDALVVGIKQAFSMETTASITVGQSQLTSLATCCHCERCAQPGALPIGPPER